MTELAVRVAVTFAVCAAAGFALAAAAEHLWNRR